MKRVKITYRSKMCTEVSEGESIEKKIDRMTQTQEPIGETAPIVYTNKTDGIVAAYDIRTDKWEIAQDAMSKVNNKRNEISKLGGMEAYKKAIADGVVKSEEMN
jgi:hypothetical protein